MLKKQIELIILITDDEHGTDYHRNLKDLIVPVGHTLIITYLTDNSSVASSYNKAIKNSKSKYKIYMPQDVEILDIHILQYLLDIFKSDNKIGIIGMAGCKELPANAVWWEGKELCGRVKEKRINSERILSFNHDSQEVEAVDGLFIATQYDLPWREDLFDGWDFYDLSQCQEFIKAGYKVMIPAIEQPWIMHHVTDKPHPDYEKYRNVFLAEYKKNNYFNFVRYEIIDLIKEEKNAVFTVLEIGCGEGRTLEAIKKIYPNSVIKGIEINENLNFADKSIIQIANIENLDKSEEWNKKYDYIIFADVLEHLTNPESVINKTKQWLKPKGHFIASIPNAQHASVSIPLLFGKWEYQQAGILDKTHLRFFTYSGIITLFNNCKCEIEEVKVKILEVPQFKEIVDNLCKNYDIKPIGFNIYQYLIRCRYDSY